MLENYSITWGGAGCIFLPSGPTGGVHDAFWDLVRLYDADVWRAYAITSRGHQLADPAGFDEWVGRTAEAWAADNEVDVEQARRMITDLHIMAEPLSLWPPPQELADEIMRRTAPYVRRHSGSLFGIWRADDVPSDGAVDVARLSPLPPKLVIPDASHLHPSLQVIVANRLGALGPSAQERLAERGVELESVTISTADVEALMRFQLPQWGRTAVFGPGRASRFLDPSSFDLTPFAVSVTGCRRASLVDQYVEDGPLVLVVGNSIDDYCFAHDLERCGVHARWLPEDALAPPQDDESFPSLLDAAAFALEGAYSTQNDHRKRLLISLSLDHTRLEAVRDSLAQSIWLRNTDLLIVDRIPLPKRRIPNLLDPEIFSEFLEEPFIGDTMARALPAAVPSEVSAENPSDLTWWVEVEDSTSSLPPRTALSELVVASTQGWSKVARCGREGIAFSSHRLGLTFSGSPISQLLERPRLRFPGASDIFDALFSSAGLSAEESSAGQFRRLSTDLWGDLAMFAEDLTDHARNRLLHAWLAEAGSGQEPGVRLSTRRRVLSLEDCQAAGGLGEAEVRAILDRLIGRRILRRGLVLKCQTCRYFDWYRMDELDRDFECHRCRASTTITSETWKGSGEPAFYYDLSEVVLQALRQNCAVPVRAANLIRSRSRSFAERSETEVTDAHGHKIELDLLIVADGAVIIGEAKVGTRLDKTSALEAERSKRLRQVAEACSADVAVFGSASRWAETTRATISEAFVGSRVEVEFLEDLDARPADA